MSDNEFLGAFFLMAVVMGIAGGGAFILCTKLGLPGFLTGIISVGVAIGANIWAANRGW